MKSELIWIDVTKELPNKNLYKIVLVTNGFDVTTGYYNDNGVWLLDSPLHMVPKWWAYIDLPDFEV